MLGYPVRDQSEYREVRSKGTYVLPAGRSSTLAMLDQQMTRANLLLSISAILSRTRLGLRSELLLLPFVALLGTGKSVHLFR